MQVNPYESPQVPSEPHTARPRPEGGTDWFALAGLFFGSLLAAYVGSAMSYDRTPAGIERRVFIVPIVLANVAGTTFFGWVLGRWLGRFIG